MTLQMWWPPERQPPGPALGRGRSSGAKGGLVAREQNSWAGTILQGERQVNPPGKANTLPEPPPHGTGRADESLGI